MAKNEIIEAAKQLNITLNDIYTSGINEENKKYVILMETFEKVFV